MASTPLRNAENVTPDRSSSSIDRAETVLAWFAAALLCYFAIAGWFNPFHYKVLAGDDLRAFHAAEQGFVALNQGAIGIFKFRPVTVFALVTVARWTGCDFAQIAFTGLAIHTLNAFLILLIFHRILRVPLALAIGVTVIATLNRFAAYLFMQEQAIMEGLGVAVLLLLMAIALNFAARPSFGRAAILTLLVLVLVHIHERYLVVVGSTVLLGALTFTVARAPAALLIGGTAAAAAANIAIKQVVLGTPVLIGTTTQPIEMNVGQVALFVWHGLLNVLGVNRGPAYLSLEDFWDSAGWVQAVSIAAAALSCFLIAVLLQALVSAWKDGSSRPAITRFLFVSSLVGVLLLSASITFRQEFRWLYPAYLAFLVLISLAVRDCSRWTVWPRVALMALVVVATAREVHLAQRHHQFYAVQAYDVANNLFETVQRVNGLGAKDRILVRGSVSDTDWIFMGDMFWRFYRIPPLEFAGLGGGAEQVRQSTVVLDYQPNSRSFVIEQSVGEASAASRRMEVTVLEAEAAGIAADPQVSTPTNKPLFLMPKNGTRAIVAVAPVEITVAPPPEADVLHLSLSHVYALGDGADIDIVAEGGSGSTELFSKRIPPLARDDEPVWRRYELPLPPETERLRVRVLSKSDPTADWLAFRDFSFRAD
jgi:hypothetical protein